MQIDLTVLGGLPVTAHVRIGQPDRSVGINQPYIDDIELCSQTSGKPLGRWIWERIEKTKGELGRIEAEIWKELDARD